MLCNGVKLFLESPSDFNINVPLYGLLPTNESCWKWKISLETKNSNVTLKFIYSEKATKCCAFSTLLLTVCIVVKCKVEISQNLVTFSEYMNFKSNISLIASCKTRQMHNIINKTRNRAVFICWWLTLLNVNLKKFLLYKRKCWSANNALEVDKGR